MTPLTAKQTVALDAITGFIDEHGYSPSTRELADMLGVSIRLAHIRILSLEECGAITRSEGVSRSIRLAGRAVGGDGGLIHALSRIEQITKENDSIDMGEYDWIKQGLWGKVWAIAHKAIREHENNER